MWKGFISSHTRTVLFHRLTLILQCTFESRKVTQQLVVPRLSDLWTVLIDLGELVRVLLRLGIIGPAAQTFLYPYHRVSGRG